MPICNWRLDSGLYQHISVGFKASRLGDSGISSRTEAVKERAARNPASQERGRGELADWEDNSRVGYASGIVLEQRRSVNRYYASEATVAEVGVDRCIEG